MGTVVDAIAPLLLLIVIGFAAGAVPRVAAIESGLNTFVLWFALPAFLFSTVAEAPPGEGVPLWFLVIAVVAPAATFGLLWLVLRLRESSRASARAAALAGSYGNVAYLGVPIVIGVFGPEAGLAAGLGQMMHNLLFMVGYPMLAELASDGSSEDSPAAGTTDDAGDGVASARSGRMSIMWVGRKLFRATVFNPVVGATLAGLAVNAAPVTLPSVADEVIDLFAGAAIPAALVAVGLALRPAMGGLRSGTAPAAPVLAATIVKMFAVPGLTVLALVVIEVDLSNIWAQVLVVMAATPTSATAYLLVSEHDGYGDLGAVTVFTTSVAAVVVLPLAVVLGG